MEVNRSETRKLCLLHNARRRDPDSMTPAARGFPSSLLCRQLHRSKLHKGGAHFFFQFKEYSKKVSHSQTSWRCCFTLVLLFSPKENSFLFPVNSSFLDTHPVRMATPGVALAIVAICCRKCRTSLMTEHFTGKSIKKLVRRYSENHCASLKNMPSNANINTWTKWG